MKPHIRAAFGIALLVLSLGAMSATQASAASCTAGFGLCVEGQQVGSPTQVPFTLLQKSGANPVINLQSGALKITCATVKTRGSNYFVGGAASMRLALTLSNCTASFGGEEGCRAGAGGEIATKNLSAAFGRPFEKATIAGAESETFMEFSVTQKPGQFCPSTLTGGYIVIGSIGCALKQIEIESVSKELVCELANSNLATRGGRGSVQFGGLVSTIELAEAWKGKKFSIR